MQLDSLFYEFDFGYMVPKLKPNTIAGYRVNFNNHILPYIGNFDIDKLTHKDIDYLCSQLKIKGLSATSVRYVLATLRKALSFAVKRGYITGNILFSYDFPKKSGFSYSVLSDEQLRHLCHIAFINDYDIYPAVLFAARYGMRRGEALGITVDDISRTYNDINYVSVRRNVNDSGGLRYIFSPKNKSSARQICLTEHDYNCLTHYSSQRKLKAYNGYQFYCRNKAGDYVTVDKLQREFKRLLKFCDCPDIRFHDLRHSYATMMLRFGVNPKIVSEVLGHSDVSTTLDIYSHSDLSMQAVLLDVLDDKPP